MNINERIAASLHNSFQFFQPTPNFNADDIFTKNLITTIKTKSEYNAVRNMAPPSRKRKHLQSELELSSNKSQKKKRISISDVHEEEEEITRVLPAHDVPSSSGVMNLPSRTSQTSSSSSQNQLALVPATKSSFESPSSGGLKALARGGVRSEPPAWHAPWKLMRVISGHLGWVRSVTVDPGNEWFATGAGDRTIKIWDLASGILKLTLTGHISAPRGLEVSTRLPYLFSCGEDKMVKCWDLEYNKVIRHYHGHLSGVYTLALHPTIDVLFTGGGDAVTRVWDIRTKNQVHVLSGHSSAVMSVKSQNVDPQVISGSEDSTVKLWDLAAGKCAATLTNHKKGVRTVTVHPREFAFLSGAADNIKKWKFPDGVFLQNFGVQRIVNCSAINSDDVTVTGGDDGSLYFWDWKTGYNFQQMQSIVQPGSLDCENAIYACTFDQTGCRLITCEGDKTIKIWKEDEDATPESHPLNWNPAMALRKDKY